MTSDWDFERFLQFAENQGWKLKKIWGHSRIFVKQDEPLPFVIQVYDRKVSIEYLNRFKQYIRNKKESEGDETKPKEGQSESEKD